MPESLETMTDSVCLRPLFWKFFYHWGDVLICLLINTSAPSHWLKSVAWPVGPVLKFRDIPDWLGLSRLCLKNAQKLLTGMLKSCYLNFRTWLTLVKKNSLKLGIKRVSCKYGRNLRIPKLIIIARNKSSYIAKSHNRTIMALGCKQYKLIRYQNL